MLALGIRVDPAFDGWRHTEGGDFFPLATLRWNLHIHVFSRVKLNRKAISFST